MRKILFIFLISVFFVSVSAQNRAKIKIRGTGTGKISIVKGKLRSSVGLEKDIAGCAYVRNSNLASIGCAAPPADFKLVDATEKAGEIFVVVASDAMGNCNVCGMCGASEAFSVIWLKFDKSLRLLEKKSVPIDFCRLDISLISDYLTVNEENQDETMKLPFIKDVLTIEFEKTVFNNGEISGYDFSHLEYNRKTPEKGFVIKTEKRNKSSMPGGQ